MTSPSDFHSDSPEKSSSAFEPKSNWVWLQERMQTTALLELDSWIEQELCQLENTFESYVTPRSLGHSLRRNFSRDEK